MKEVKAHLSLRGNVLLWRNRSFRKGNAVMSLLSHEKTLERPWLICRFQDKNTSGVGHAGARSEVNGLRRKGKTPDGKFAKALSELIDGNDWVISNREVAEWLDVAQNSLRNWRNSTFVPSLPSQRRYLSMLEDRIAHERSVRQERLRQEREEMMAEIAEAPLGDGVSDTKARNFLDGAVDEDKRQKRWQSVLRLRYLRASPPLGYSAAGLAKMISSQPGKKIKPQAVSNWGFIPDARVQQVALATGLPNYVLRPDAWDPPGSADETSSHVATLFSTNPRLLIPYIPKGEIVSSSSHNGGGHVPDTPDGQGGDNDNAALRAGELRQFSGQLSDGPVGPNSIKIDAELWGDSMNDVWRIPPNVLLPHVRDGALHKVHVIRVAGDSMAPTLESGGFALVDAGDAQMSVDGLYAIRNETNHEVIKRLVLVPNSNPPRVVIVSDNPVRQKEYERNLDEVKIIGRVIMYTRFA